MAMQRYVGRVLQGEDNKHGGDSSVKKPQQDSIAFMLKDIWYLCVANWYWFLLSVIIALCLGYYYLLITPPVYQRSISILIKSKEGEDDRMMKQLGISSVPANLINEMELMKTEQIAEEIAKRLNLNVEYLEEGKFHDNILYGEESPVRISFFDLPDNENVSFHLQLKGDGTAIIKDLNYKGETLGKSLSVPLNKTVDTLIGKIEIATTSNYKEGKGKTLKVLHKNIKGVAAGVRGRIQPSLRKNTSILDIAYSDVSKTRAEDVLNTLIGVYNENWIKDRNLKTTNTDKFIKERLAFIEDELGDVEQSISAWKSQNLMLDVDAAGSYAQSQINEAENEMQELSNQIYMTKYIKDYLTDGQHQDQLLPANSGITNSSIESMIKEYNNTMLNRNNHLANSSTQNPLVKDLDESLDVLKGSIMQSLDYELTMLQSKANSIRSRQGLAVSRVASNPQKAQQLLSVERQQKVKEELYLYLLQKREENELSQAFDAYNNQFIESPHGSNAPVSPQSQKVMLIAFGIGLFLPALSIAAKEFFNTKVRGKKDIQSLSAPYAGDIPTHKVKGKTHAKKGEDEMPEVLVVEKNRDMINEAFRVVRSNIEFILGFDKQHQVVMVTSMTPGSGKTFITANLSSALAIRGKKVLIIDLDLRKGSLSHYAGKPKKGLSNYLSGQVNDYHELMIELGKVDILPCGTIPPNPSELLFSPRFKEMMEEVKETYDYVFLDCPPVEIVADASILSSYADLTLFVVRVGKLERDQVPEIEEWYQNKKYGNLAILLNGVETSSSKYGYHHYGYHRYGSKTYGY